MGLSQEKSVFWNLFIDKYSASISASKLYDFLDSANLNLDKVHNVKDRVDRGGAIFFSGNEISIDEEIDFNEELVLRKYFRGGVISKFNNSIHFRNYFNKTRPELEYSLLLKLKSKGFSVPTPVFAAYRDIYLGFFYQAFLCTKKLKDYGNLLSFLIEDSLPEVTSRKAARLSGEQALRLLDFGIYHVDFHPGNVLVKAHAEKVVIIDFDKYKEIHSSKTSYYKDKLINRWSRSVNKHKLSSYLIEEFTKAFNSKG